MDLQLVCMMAYRYGSIRVRADPRCLPSGYLCCNSRDLIWQQWFQSWQSVEMISQGRPHPPAVALLPPPVAAPPLLPLPRLHQVLMMMRLVIGNVK